MTLYLQMAVLARTNIAVIQYLISGSTLMLQHKGGSLQTWNSDGTKGDVLHYGTDLNKSCPECKVAKLQRCVTKSGKLLGKVHSSREQ